MPFQKMRFRGDTVFVLVDEAGRPVLDRDGRAEMKYREADLKSYRPQPANLSGVSAGAIAPEPAPGRVNASGASAPRARAKAPAAKVTERREAVATAAAAVGRRAGGAGPDAGTFHVWTDGACSGNPGPMGIGVVVIAGDQREEVGEYLGIGTNNIAELVAIERGLEIVARQLSERSGSHVRVYSDSSYAIGLLDKAWKAKANQDVVARIRAVLSAFPGRLEFVKVKGHSGLPENERCDELGRQAIASARALRR